MELKPAAQPPVTTGTRGPDLAISGRPAGEQHAIAAGRRERAKINAAPDTLYAFGRQIGREGLKVE